MRELHKLSRVFVQLEHGSASSENTDITAQKMKCSIKDFFSKCDQIRRKLQIWWHLLKKTLMGNFIFEQCIFSNLQLLELAIDILPPFYRCISPYQGNPLKPGDSCKLTEGKMIWCFNFWCFNKFENLTSKSFWRVQRQETIGFLLLRLFGGIFRTLSNIYDRALLRIE